MSHLKYAGDCHIGPMPAEEYHADHSAVSKSMLWKFRRRVSAYHREFVLGEKPPFAATRAMNLGDLTHAALLEPYRLATDYVAYPDHVLGTNGAASTKAAKEFRDEHESAGRVVLKAEDFAAASAMVESVRTAIGPWLDVPAKIEHALYWVDSASGVRCKCRPDWLVLNEGAAFVLDVKTTTDVSPDEFRRKVETFGYWLQDAHYSAGVRALTGIDPTFLFVVVETEWPWQCAVYRIDDNARAKGEIVYRDLLAQLAERHRDGNWKDEWEGVVNSLDLRPWAYE